MKTQAELLTEQFYRWELRGRGWQVWPYAVELEPPFVPFFGHWAPTVQSPRDDARKPSFLDRLLSGEPETRVEPAFQPVVDWPEPEPSEFQESPPLIELRVLLPPEYGVTKHAAEQFLLGLTSLSCPAGFEILGTEDEVSVQLACRKTDQAQVHQQLQAYFPEAWSEEKPRRLANLWDRTGEKESAIVEFGLSDEFMLPLITLNRFDVDPLAAVVGSLSGLGPREVGLLQVLFQPVRNAWAESVMRSVTDWEGKAFFADAPDMVSRAKLKVSRPLFAAIIRVAAQSPDSGRAWELVRAAGGALAQFSNPPSNELIPLSNEGYSDEAHALDLLNRRSRRSGMLLNSEELVSIAHLPSASVRGEKFSRERRKSKAAPDIALGGELIL